VRPGQLSISVAVEAVPRRRIRIPVGQYIRDGLNRTTVGRNW
jgi:hypothetical protein